MKRKTTVKQPAAMLSINGGNMEAVAEARKAINDILAAPHVDNGTKVEALKALYALCGVSNMNISNCNFQGGSE